jgi:hypothetical protein
MTVKDNTKTSQFFWLKSYFDCCRTSHETTWAPILWAVHLLQKEKNAGRYKIEPPVYANLIQSFEYLETSNRRIFDHGWVNFPLGEDFKRFEVCLRCG